MVLSVRRLTETDLEIAGTIAMAAYNRSQTLEPELRRYLALQPDGWYLALLDETPVGLGGAIDYGPFAYLGMMSVLPSVQSRGIGMALMQAILAWLDGRGCQTVLLNARERAVSLYERCGFVEIDQTLQLQLAQHTSLPQSSIEGVSSLTRAELSAIAAFDAPAFGASRAAVLSAYFAADPRRFLVSRDAAGQLGGFLVAGQSSLGPWHAATVEAAEKLLQQALVLPSAGSLTVSVSANNVTALDLLQRSDFVLERTLPHMRRGQSLQRDPQRGLYGMASLALG